MCLAQNTHGCAISAARIVSYSRIGQRDNGWSKKMVTLVLHQVFNTSRATLNNCDHKTYLNTILISNARCETLKHGLEARRHLQEYVASTYFCHVCGEGTSRAILKWLANSFFNVQHKLLFYYRLHVRCFDQYVNSAVEGQHSAVKTTTTR